MRRSAPPATAGPQQAPAARGGPLLQRTPRFGSDFSEARDVTLRPFPLPREGFPCSPFPPPAAPGHGRPEHSGPDSGRTPRPRSAGPGDPLPGGTAARGFRRSGLTSSLTRGCSLPRSWAQGRRCRLWSWPRTSSGRLCGSASPAFAWNSSCTFAIFLPAARPARTAPPRRPAPAARGGAARRPPGGRTGHGRRAALRGPDVRGASRRGAAPSSGGRERDGTWRERAGCEERCWAPPSRCLSPCHAAPRPPGCTGNLCFPLIVPLRDGNGVKL